LGDPCWHYVHGSTFFDLRTLRGSWALTTPMGTVSFGSRPAAQFESYCGQVGLGARGPIEVGNSTRFAPSSASDVFAPPSLPLGRRRDRRRPGAEQHEAKERQARA
jgi:hypothetical protein